MLLRISSNRDCQPSLRNRYLPLLMDRALSSCESENRPTALIDLPPQESFTCGEARERQKWTFGTLKIILLRPSGSLIASKQRFPNVAQTQPSTFPIWLRRRADRAFLRWSFE